MTPVEFKEMLRSEAQILSACIEGAARILLETTCLRNTDAAMGLTVQGDRVRDLIEKFYEGVM